MKYLLIKSKQTQQPKYILEIGKPFNAYRFCYDPNTGNWSPMFRQICYIKDGYFNDSEIVEQLSQEELFLISL